MTCRNCVHFEVCDSGRHIGEYIEDDGVYTDGVEKECPTFRPDASIIDLDDVISRIEECCIVVNRPGIEKIKAEYGANCGWISPSERLPENDDFVLAIVSGPVIPNIMLIHSYEIASYSKEDGWCIECFPEAKHPTIHYWRHLPSQPKDLEGSIPDCIPLPPSNPRLGEFMKKILSSEREGGNEKPKDLEGSIPDRIPLPPSNPCPWRTCEKNAFRKGEEKYECPSEENNGYSHTGRTQKS